MKKKYLIAGITFIGFLIITILLLSGNIGGFDEAIYSFFRGMRSNNIINGFFKFVTHLGDTLPITTLVIVLLIFFKKRNRLLLGSSVILNLGVNQAIKHIIMRPRPPIVERLVSQGGYSYPSGHTMMATSLFGVLIYIVLKEVKNKKIKICLVTLFMLLILLIGISRIYVRVHYPSDVLGGYLLTTSLLILDIDLVNKYFRRAKK